MIISKFHETLNSQIYFTTEIFFIKSVLQCLATIFVVEVINNSLEPIIFGKIFFAKKIYFVLKTMECCWFSFFSSGGITFQTNGTSRSGDELRNLLNHFFPTKEFKYFREITFNTFESVSKQICLRQKRLAIF